MPKKTNKFTESVKAAWTKFKEAIDWYEANMRYFAMFGRVLCSRWALGLLVAFGWTAPQTAESIKHSVLGENIAQSVEVVDNARGVENPEHDDPVP